MEAVLPGESSRVVVAHLTEREYELARVTIPEIGAFKDYADWLDYRAGALLGLEMAGLTVEQVSVDLEMFVVWRRETSTDSSISALDEFACSQQFPINRER